MSVTVSRQVLYSVLGPMLRHVPLEQWPAWCANAFAIKVPANVQPKPDKSPEGGASVRIILHLLDQVRHLPGDIAECGVFRGATIIPLALYVVQNALPKRVVGFDSFSGFDQAIAADLHLGGAEDAEKRVGGFNQTSQGYVSMRAAALRLTPHVELIKGYFEETLPAAAESQYCFVHLDCDIYSSYKQCLGYFFPRLVPGGIILLDEYNDPPWPGCNKAVDEFLAEHQLEVRYIEMDGYEKYYIAKG